MIAAGTERRLRFDRQARATSTLKHPNVLTVFDVLIGTIVRDTLPPPIVILNGAGMQPSR